MHTHTSKDTSCGPVPGASTGCPKTEESQRRLRQELAGGMIDASIDIMIVLDCQLRIVEWNKAAEHASGLRYVDVLMKPFQSMYPAADSITGYNFAMKNALLGIKCFIPSGARFYLPGHYETHFIPLLDSKGGVTGVLKILHDVAHRVKAEDKLRELNRELTFQNHALRDAHQELAAFAKITAHELKEPLRAIQEFARLTMSQDAAALSATGRLNLERVLQVAERMVAQADDIINFETLGRESAFEDIDLTAVLQHELAAMQPAIRNAGIWIRFERLPTITGYASAIKELLRQLIDNAIKFRRPGVQPEIIIECERVEGFTILNGQADKNLEYYHLSVDDNGIGFDAQYGALIFEMFERLHPDAAYPGRGVGLAIAQKAARMHDGFITAESIPGEGSTFHIYLPIG